MYTPEQKREAQECLESRLIMDTSLIFTITRSVSRSGKTREVEFLFIIPTKASPPLTGLGIYGVDVLPVSRHIAALLDLPLNDRGAVICRQTPEAIAGRLGLLLLKNASRIFTREL